MWRFLFVVCGDLWIVLGGCPATFCPSRQYVTLMHLHRHGCLSFTDALLCCWCVFTVRRKQRPC